jgi:hypothetical protein
MAFKSSLYLTAHESPYILIVEPWANEFTIFLGETCALVAIHPTVTPTITAMTCRGNDLEVYVNEGGATFEFWRGGTLELSMLIPIRG